MKSSGFSMYGSFSVLSQMETEESVYMVYPSTHCEKVKSLPLLTVEKDWTPLPEWLGPGSPTPVEGSN